MVSTRGRYAIRVMLDLAEHGADGYIPIKEVAARQEGFDWGRGNAAEISGTDSAAPYQRASD